MIRVLFVDDEPDVLEGLENRLRAMRKSWKMCFALGAREALDHLEHEPVDVVVSDMRMPGLDGPSLFRHLRATHPHTIRIALSGQTNEESLLRTLALAHQFLAKPATTEAIQSAIATTFALRELLADDGLERLVRAVTQLPPRPRLYEAVTAVLERPDASLSDVTTLLEQEPAVTARLLQLSNSAFFARTSAVSTVRDAIAFLGLNAVRATLLSSDLFDWAARSGVATERLERLSRHTHDVALLAARLAPEGEQSGLAFTGAVLHDVGRLVLWTAREADVEAAGGFSRHAQVGGRLLALWGLPLNLVEMVAHHERPSATSRCEWGPLMAVHVANALIHELDGDGASAPLDEAAVRACGKGAELSAWRTLAGSLRESGAA